MRWAGCISPAHLPLTRTQLVAISSANEIVHRLLKAQEMSGKKILSAAFSASAAGIDSLPAAALERVSD
jgi:hypothetical protein